MTTSDQTNQSNQTSQTANPLTRSMNFLESNWTKLPPWARITSYFMILGAMIYSMFANSYVDGKLTVSYQGEIYDIRDTLIQIDHGGRLMRISPDDQGYFSFPMPTKLPFLGILVSVIYDRDTEKVVSGKLSTTQGILNQRVELVYDYETNSLDLGQVRKIAWLPRLFGIESAHADGHQTPVASSEAIQALVLNTIGDLKGVPAQSLNLNSRVRSDLNLNNIDLSILNGVIKKSYGVDVWSVNRYNPTVDEIIKATHMRYFQLNAGVNQ